MTPLQKVSAAPMWEKRGLAEVKASARAVREGYATATWKRRVLPNLIVAGAQRSGTTALTGALVDMAMVARPRRGKGSHYFSLNYSRGWQWFQGQFPTRSAARRTEQSTGYPLFVLDACPYYLFHPLAIERMRRDLPDVKVLVMLRDPAQRAQSHYHHSVAYGHETLGLVDALEAEASRLHGEEDLILANPDYVSIPHEHFSYTAKGMYAGQVERLFEHYTRDQVKIIDAEAFYKSRPAVLADLTRWLGLPTTALSGHPVDRNANPYESNSMVLANLAKTFARPNEDLFDLLGERFAWATT